MYLNLALNIYSLATSVNSAHIPNGSQIFAHLHVALPLIIDVEVRYYSHLNVAAGYRLNQSFFTVYDGLE